MATYIFFGTGAAILIVILVAILPAPPKRLYRQDGCRYCRYFDRGVLEEPCRRCVDGDRFEK